MNEERKKKEWRRKFIMKGSIDLSLKDGKAIRIRKKLCRKSVSEQKVE